MVLTCIYYDLDISVKIENMFLLDEQLLVVSKTSIYDVDVLDMKNHISYKQIFNNEENANTDKVIKDVEYSKKHESLYMMIRNDNDEQTIMCKYSLVVHTKEKILICNINKKVDRFELSLLDPLIVYLVCKKKIYQYKINSIEANLKFLLKEKFANMKNNTLNLYDKQFKKIYSNEINKIKFFKFDNRMKYFYTHDNHLIKKCLFDTGEEVYTLLNKQAVVRNLWFAKKFFYMIRYVIWLTYT